jgi:hypothetical protein
MTKQATQADAGPQLLLGDERRRSQRVMIRIPVTLEVMVAGKKVTVHAGTASVNDHGAMLLCTKSFPVDTLLDMINDRTAQKQTCRITRTATENQQGYLIPIEFLDPAPGFWHISFPPPGWKPLDN